MGMLDKASQVAHRTPRDAKATGAQGVHTLTPREEEAAWRSEMLGELRKLANTTTSRPDASQIVNDVLDVTTFVFDSTGSRAFSYQTAVGSIVVVNTGATSVTVTSGTQGGDTAPTVGRGVQLVPAGSWLAVPIGAHAFTLWGTAAATCGLQVFAGMQGFGLSR
jgi:hypothetical protein